MSISWLLFKKSGKQSLGRLILTASAVALGALMILLFMSGLHALSIRTDGKRDITYDLLPHAVVEPIEGVEPLKIHFGGGLFSNSLLTWQDESVTVIKLHATDESSPQIADLPTPEAGEYYVSGALDKIIRENPDAEVGSRFGQKQLGLIPDKYLASPDTLTVVRGMSAEEADTIPTTDAYAFDKSRGFNNNNFNSSGVMGVMLVVGATILLFPIVLFVSVATQLGSAQREKRYAAMRLVGATKPQITRIMAFESISAALVGIIVGSLAYVATLPLLADYKLEGMRFWMEELIVPLDWYLIAVALTLFFCWFANWWGMRHVRTSPLGVVKTQKVSKKPRVWRLLPLVFGLGFFTWMALPAGSEWIKEAIMRDSSFMLITLAAIVAVMFGLVLAGSWLTYRVAAMFSRLTKGAQTLLATKRISSHSKQIFRSVSGVVLALFAGSFYLIAVSGEEELSASTISDNGFSQLKLDTAYVYSEDTIVSDELTTKLQKQSFVRSVMPTQTVTAEKYDGNAMTCVDLTKYTERNCPQGSKDTDFATINFWDSVVADEDIVVSNAPKTQNPATAGYFVQLDSSDNLDKLRTFLIKDLGDGVELRNGAHEQHPRINPMISELAGLVYAGMVVTLFVAVASLVVSTVGGLLERKRSLMTLKLGGMTIGQMKKVVMIEALIPLVAVSLVAAGLGGWIGATFIATFSTTLQPTITPLYIAIVVGGLAAAVIGIYCILPTLNKITSLEENRTE